MFFTNSSFKPLRCENHFPNALNSRALEKPMNSTMHRSWPRSSRRTDLISPVNGELRLCPKLIICTVKIHQKRHCKNRSAIKSPLYHFCSKNASQVRPTRAVCTDLDASDIAGAEITHWCNRKASICPSKVSVEAKKHEMKKAAFQCKCDTSEISFIKAPFPSDVSVSMPLGLIILISWSGLVPKAASLTRKPHLFQPK